MRKEKISVVIPCYNEEKGITKNIEIIYTYLKEHYSSFEIIVSNDGSTDKTTAELAEIKNKIPFKIINVPINTGKGNAVKVGMLATSPESKMVMFLDADLAIPIDELNKFVTALENQNLDLVIASRFVPGLKVLEPVLWYRKTMEIAFRFLRVIILNNWQVRDSQCGFKVFRRSAAIKIFNLTTISRFAFDSEVIFLAKKFNFSVKELPITLCNPRESHIRMIFDPINMFFALFKIRWNNLKGIYKVQAQDLWKDVTISADDFGASPRANKNILALIQENKIDRISVMIKRNFSKEEIKLLRKSNLKIDLHLELFTDQELKLKKNTLLRGISFFIGYLRGEFYHSRVKKMWTEQIFEFEQIFGQKPDGLNSHEHFHLFPPFFRIICQIAKKNHIRYVRLGKNGQPFARRLIRHILQVLFLKNKKTLHSFPKLDSSDYMLSLDWIIKNKKPYKFLKAETEIVCHPEREEEYIFLKNLPHKK
ncbi:MAG TPA: hypothetical protein DEA46_03320 [Candidatus Moranbacteria bacterium]|nr:hypothetical protein [Candidatus Moranbacteria bacterium]